MALLLWRSATQRTAYCAQARPASSTPYPAPAETWDGGTDGEKGVVPVILPPQNLNREDAQAYLAACRAFIGDHRDGAALLCRLAAREEWGELREAARSLCDAARALHAPALAAAALSVWEATLVDTAAAARHVEHCIPALNQTLGELERLLRDNAEPARGEKA